MSRRTAESNKAILAAWNKEIELVQEGKGTRDWTPKQQQNILEKGKAYDEDGVAFQGQHMKSSEMYPEYQGDPGNIQFLTRAEHLEAHNGNWRNPTNWHFNPVKKEKVDFGDGPFIPCKIISLSEPVIKPNIEVESNSDCAGAKEEVQSKQETNPAFGNKPSREIRPKKSVESKVTSPSKNKNTFIGVLKKAGRFIAEHPAESIEIAGVVVTGTIKAISSIRGKGTSSISRNTSEAKPTNTIEKVTEIMEKASRNLPSENDVSGHKQRYHTKNGVVWKNKAPYHRGGTK